MCTLNFVFFLFSENFARLTQVCVVVTAAGVRGQRLFHDDDNNALYQHKVTFLGGLGEKASFTRLLLIILTEKVFFSLSTECMIIRNCFGFMCKGTHTLVCVSLSKNHPKRPTSCKSLQLRKLT